MTHPDLNRPRLATFHDPLTHQMREELLRIGYRIEGDLLFPPEGETAARKLEKADDSIRGFVAQAQLMEQQLRELRAFQNMVNRHNPENPAHPDDSRDVWYWQGDGEDHLESMVHQLPVVIRAEQLRELLKTAERESILEHLDLVSRECDLDEHKGLRKAIGAIHELPSLEPLQADDVLAQPTGWLFERVNDRHIRIVDPTAPYTLLLDLSDQAPSMRVLWRLACGLIDAQSAKGVSTPLAAPAPQPQAAHDPLQAIADNAAELGLTYENTASMLAVAPTQADEADVRELRKWLNEDPNRPVDRQALARLLASARPAPAVAELPPLPDNPDADGWTNGQADAIEAWARAALAAQPEQATAEAKAQHDNAILERGIQLGQYRERQRAQAAAEHAPAEGARLSADDVQWIVNDIAELGVMIRGQAFFLYKGHSLVYEEARHDDGRGPMHYRPVFKREFGECAHPINYQDPERIGTVSLDDSDDWRELPAAGSTPQPKSTQAGWLGLESRPEGMRGAYLVRSKSGQVAPWINGIIHNAPGTECDWSYGQGIAAWMPFTASPVQSPAPAPKFDFDDLRSRVMGSIHDHGSKTPEEDETWEEWHVAAFDLLGDAVGRLFEAAQPKAVAARAPAVGAGAARDAALDEAAALCEMWNTSPGSALAKEIRKLKDAQ